jgi:23S rRNA U2552 (ribose-2'-O)-methylase RlmE/FtsJ
VPNTKVTVSANSAVTVSSSTSSTQDAIQAAFRNLRENDPNTNRDEESELYVTRVNNVRIVWKREKDGSILVQAVYVPAG